ncbi:MAG TPA: ABC transporter permease [Candidatus Thermoplasmatota archaeon]|nr:ABC transporter permease [Candidatus Thermoplasmatota archaeon]
MTSAAPQTRWDAMRLALAPRLREWRYGIYRLRRSFLAMVGLALVLVYVVVALAAPLIAPPEPGQKDNYHMPLDFRNDLRPPSAEHPFGTGVLGIDIFYGVVWGSRISIVMGLSVVAAGAFIGTILGGLAGYFGGKLDEIIMRITDVFLAMPLLILAMGVSVALGGGLFNIGLALAITWWPSYTRLVRGQVLSLRENQYVEAARSVGASDLRIIRRHILPNAMSPILVQGTLDIGTVILVSAALSFIGFGPSGSDFAEWGTLVSRGKDYMQRAWWPVTIPGLAILGFSLGFNLLGDGLRDLLDPRLRK